MSKTIAVIGASANRAKFGNKAVRAYSEEGWKVYPINRSESEIEGLEVASDLSAIDAHLDRISVYLPPPITLQLLPELAAAGAGEVWLNPGSFDEAVLAGASRIDLPLRPACSIVDIGRSPGEFQ